MALSLGLVHAADLAAPAALTLDGTPPVPQELVKVAGRYLEFRTAGFLGWHPKKREMLISTRFGETPQLHWVDHPGGSRQQLTFTVEPIVNAHIQPVMGAYAVFSQDTGGGDFFNFTASISPDPTSAKPPFSPTDAHATPAPYSRAVAIASPSAPPGATAATATSG